MIYIKRNAKLIPDKILAAAIDAQNQLEKLPPEKREDFIKKNAKIWRAFIPYLSKMSYGKCWYSENRPEHSLFEIDHFRPKLEAKRAEFEIDPGYEWLAFSWENFRLSAQRSNRATTNEESGEVEGKSTWFPLLDDQKASWNRRCEDQEKPVLLDPTNKDDVLLIQVLPDGRMGPPLYCAGKDRRRVRTSIQLLGLNLPKLTEARKQLIREIDAIVEHLVRAAEAIGDNEALAEAIPLHPLIEQLRSKALPSAPYSATARMQLAQKGFGQLCAHLDESMAGSH